MVKWAALKVQIQIFTPPKLVKLVIYIIVIIDFINALHGS